MKRIYSIFPLLFALATVGCKKEEKIDFQFNKDLDFVPTALDNWLTAAFTDPYNIDVKYRYDRYKDGDLNQNLVPAKEEKVEEQMQMVLKGYLLPYEAAGGKPFIRTYAPKEWILSGSYSIQPDGSRVLATSGGGRNITLYEVNAVNIAVADIARPRLKTIHHEFTHTLDQNKRMPVEFENISRGNYSESWRNTTLNPDAANDALGFVSRYARSSVIEDFAETAGFLIAEGQLWYDHKAGNVPASGYDILKKKEAAVVKYFRDSYGVDFRKLQREVAAAMYENFNDTQKQSLPYWFFKQGLFNRDLGINSAVVSADVKQRLDLFKAAVLDYSKVSKYVVQDIRFMFGSTDNSLIVRVSFRSGTAPIIHADYNFTYQQDPGSGKISFVKVAQGTGVNYTNAGMFMTTFMEQISSYLTQSDFMMDWSLSDQQATRRDEGFFRTGGLYKKDERTSFLNFELLRTRK